LDHVLPGRAIECCGWAAGEVLFDPLVVSYLCGHRYWRGLASWWHHWGLSGGWLRWPEKPRKQGFNPVRMLFQTHLGHKT